MITSCTVEVKENRKNIDNIIFVKAQYIPETSIARTYNGFGVLTSKRITKLSFQTSGMIQKLLVDEGSIVRKGQLLATLDMTELSAQVKQASISFEKSNRDRNRAQKLYSDTAITMEQLQNTNSAYDIALETQNIAEFNLKHSQIIAPDNGRVMSILSHEDEIVSAGAPSIILSSLRNNEWIIKTGLSDKDIVCAKIGDKATVKFDAFPGIDFSGYVSNLPETDDPTSGLFEAEITINPSDQKFINGLLASVTIQSTKKQQAFLLPSEAVVQADGNKAYIFVVNAKNQTAKQVPITICNIMNNKIAIIENVNKLGKIIISGAAYLEDGSKISFTTN